MAAPLYVTILFVILLVIDVSLIGERAVSIRTSKRIWPPPADRSWERAYINYGLGFAQFATPVLAGLDRGSMGIEPLSLQIAIGAILLGVGAPLGL